MLDITDDPGLALRLRAAARFEALGWPSTRLESWHWFSTRPFESLDLTRPPETRSAPLPELPSPRVVFIDGRFAPHLLALDGLPARDDFDDLVRVRALSDYDEATFASIVQRLVPDDAALEQANLAFLTDGAHIVVGEGARLPLLHLVFLTTGDGVVHGRTVIELGRRASAAIMSHHIGIGASQAAPSYLHNHVTELHLADGASLELAKRISESPKGSHIESVYARLHRDARFSSFTLSLDGDRVRTAITVELAGENAEASVDGLYLGQGKSQLDHTSDIRHALPHTRSSETWAGVLDDRSVGTFQGLVRIAPNAVRSATRQLTRTLILAEGASANARPELHIDCDDVSAAHGASVGQLDPLQLFYLESRGIPTAEARRMLVLGFVGQVLAVAPGALRPHIVGLVEARLGAATLDVSDLQGEPAGGPEVEEYAP